MPKKSQIQPQSVPNPLIDASHGSLMDRVVSILEQARANVARSINSNMVIAYWLIGREIVEALQSGENRAEYGENLLNDLSGRLTKRYGRGYSVTNLRYFRLFYQLFSERPPEKFITRQVMNWRRLPAPHRQRSSRRPLLRCDFMRSKQRRRGVWYS